MTIFANRDDAATGLSKIAGVQFIDAGFGRAVFAPIKDGSAMVRLSKVIRDTRPDLIHLFNAKPTLLGLAVVRISGTSARVVNTVTGLGHAFTQSKLARGVSTWLYRRLLPRAQVTIFQNRDDLHLFQSLQLLGTSRAELIIGSGVDLERFHPPMETAPDSRRCTVMMAARLLRSKGVPDFLDAAVRARAALTDVRFLLAGELEPGHPDGIGEAELRRLASASGVEFLGYRRDLDRLLQTVDLVVLPSYYREGVPRILVEAAACGVATITTDSPGCREAVMHGVTGLLVPPRDSVALSQAIVTLARDRGLLRSMGRMARERAVAVFDMRSVTQRHQEIYDELLSERAH